MESAPPSADGPADPHQPPVTTLAMFSIASRLNRLPVVGTHRRAVLAIGLGLFFDLYEVFLSTVLLVVFVQDFAADDAARPLLLSSVFAGMFVGTTLLTFVADRIGRRQAFLLTIGLYSAASLAGAFSPDLWFLVAARIVAGLGIGAELPVADTYLADLLPQRVRGRYIAWAYTIGFCGVPVAGVLAGLLINQTVLGVAGWRWMFVIGALGALVIWLLRRQLPESPRWLESVGRSDEAARIVASMEAEAAALGTIPAPRHDIDATPTVSVLDSLTRSGLRRRWLMMTLFHPLQGVGYYGFSSLAVIVLTEQGYGIVTSLAFVTVTYLGYPLGSLLSVPFIEQIDRRWLIAASGIAVAALGMLFAFAAAPTTIMTFGFAYTAASNVFSNSFHVYQVELFPTELRARAAGGPYALGRLSIGVMPFVLVPVLHAYGPEWAFGITGAALIIAVLSILTLGPRTTGLPLETIGDHRTMTTRIDPRVDRE